MLLATNAEDPSSTVPRDEPIAEPKMSAKTNRLHISLPETLTARVEALREETSAMSVAEVFRDALIVYAKLLKEHKAGNDIILQPRDGSTPKMLSIFLD